MIRLDWVGGDSNSVGSQLRGLWARVRGPFGVAFGAAIVSACVSTEISDPKAYDPGTASRLFGVGFQDIAEVYVDDIVIADVALAGLGGLDVIDPDIDVWRDSGSVVMELASSEVGRFEVPGDQDVGGWSALTAGVLARGRTYSEAFGEAETERLYEAVFDGLLSELDGFSRYAGREEANENRASRDGFGGIGVRIRQVEEGVRVVSVMEGTPAESAGLLARDLIIEIDGETVQGLSQREVVRRLRGPIDTKVKLTVLRDAIADRLALAITRAHVVPQTVTYRREGRVGYVKISGFNQRTAHSLRKKIRKAQDDLSGQLEGLVVDLRGNPGGLLDQSVAVSDVFLSGGRVVSTHGRHRDSHQYFDASPGDLIAGLPIVVLINGSSASSAEIVAAALQDSGRAVVVGSNSFGKGTVQTVLPLPNEGELTLTWARFHAPSGYALEGRGVLPDICTSAEYEATAKEVLEQVRSGQLVIDHAYQVMDPGDNDPESRTALRARCPRNDRVSPIDLEVAVGLLSDPALFARLLNEPESAQLEDKSHTIIAAEVACQGRPHVPETPPASC